jgi:lysophospholipase L1-like esterase
LPWLVRRLLGLRAALLDRDLQALAARLGARHCALDMPFAAQYLARDGYHPSALGYRLWAQALAQRLRAFRAAR